MSPTQIDSCHMPTAAQPNAMNRPALLWGVWTLACAALIAVAGAIGGPLDPIQALGAVLGTHVLAGWPAFLLILASLGYSRWLLLLARRLPRTQTAPVLRPVAPASGFACLLMLIVLTGTAGLLGTIPAIAITALGLAGLLTGLKQARPFRIPTPPGWLWLGLPAIAILAVAGANPPGVLWSSEYAGYDVLSYHLQLPKEWLVLGHTRPLDHNVYSFLPGALEQAFAFIGALSGAPHNGDGLIADGAWRLTSAHTLHATLTIMAACMVARLTKRLALASGGSHRAARTSSALAGGLVLCTPWSVVVGSMAYNEMGVVFLGAAALLAAARRDGSPIARGVIVGVLVGIACLVKPTALLFVGGPAAVIMLRFGRAQDWPKLLAAAGIVGLLTLAPWLVRNAVITGNPVFPLATDLFGTGHWTPRQASRFATAHAFDGSWPDRLRLLIFADPDASDAANAVSRYRGTANTQWLLAFPVAALAGVGLVIFKRSRAIGVGLALCLGIQLIAWLGFTHLQSRFLIPCLIVLGPMVGVGCSLVRTPKRLGAGLGIAVVLLQATALWTIFAEQRGGQPNALLGAQPGIFMGEPYAPEIGRVLPQAYLNFEIPADASVLLIGGATPLYYSGNVVYATVWDAPPVLGLMNGRTNPEIRYVLIDDSELARQRASGYLDERISPDTLAALAAGWQLVRAWPEIGIRLYRVPPAMPGPGTRTEPTP